MPEIIGAELEIDRLISADPTNGVIAALNNSGAVVNLLAWDPASGDVTHSAPTGSGGNTRRHLFDRPIVMSADILFTDALYDIGKTGATRPRDGFFSRNVVIGGTAAVTGTLSPLGLLDASGAGAGQIKFPATQNASADANTLDDYEEGSWTPTRNGFTEVVGAGAINASGRYTKIGNLVYITASIVCTGGATIAAAAGVSYLSGLPYTPSQSGVGAWANDTTAAAGGFVDAYGTLVVMVTSWTATSAVFVISVTYRTT